MFEDATAEMLYVQVNGIPSDSAGTGWWSLSESKKIAYRNLASFRIANECIRYPL
jgi:hypothetical protein